MGRKRDRKLRFLADHPICCFCGGTQPSEEPDHVPARAFFENKTWPEGFEFPACFRCNHATSKAEQAVSRFSLLAEDIPDEVAKQNLNELLRYNPEFLSNMTIPGPSDVRRMLRAMGSAKPLDVCTQDIPFMRLGEGILESTDLVGRKLMLALYYLHAGKILPQSGRIVLHFMTNALNPEHWDRIVKAVSPLNSAPPLVRSNSYLDDQFTYRHAVMPSPNDPALTVAAFFVWFRRSFGYMGIVAEDPTVLSQLKKRETLSPFCWD